MAIRAGKLRHKITIQQRSTERDEYGGVPDAWTDVATVRASVEPLQGREFYASQQMQAEVTTRFRIRYRSGVKPAMRVRFNERSYDITSVINPDERNGELHLMAVEIIE